MRTVRGPVLNTQGRDIAPLVNAAAALAGVDAVHLLGLLWAESEGAHPYAERWGSRTREAQALIARIEAGDEAARDELQALLMDGDRVGLDVSFGPSQYIIPYHYRGDRSLSVENVLGVRSYVFSHYEEDIEEAAKKYRRCLDGVVDRGDPALTALAAVVAYNSGGDNLDTEWYPRKYAGNLRRYREKLAWAEGYARQALTGDARIAHLLDVLWGWKEALRPVVKEPIIKEIEDAIIGIKEERGLQ